MGHCRTPEQRNHTIGPVPTPPRLTPSWGPAGGASLHPAARSTKAGWANPAAVCRRCAAAPGPVAAGLAADARRPALVFTPARGAAAAALASSNVKCSTGHRRQFDRNRADDDESDGGDATDDTEAETDADTPTGAAADDAAAVAAVAAAAARPNRRRGLLRGLLQPRFDHGAESPGTTMGGAPGNPGTPGTPAAASTPSPSPGYTADADDVPSPSGPLSPAIGFGSPACSPAPPRPSAAGLPPKCSASTAAAADRVPPGVEWPASADAGARESAHTGARAQPGPSPPRQPAALCGACGATAASKQCGGCRQVWYCSKPCQLEHWKRGGHRAVCRAARRAGS